MASIEVPAVATRLIDALQTNWPLAARLASDSPRAAVEAVDGLTLTIRSGSAKTACPVDGMYHDSPPTITVFDTGNAARNAFTCLHELGHHLIAYDTQWQYHDAPALAADARRREEDVVNAFASRLLIPDSLLHRHVFAPVRASQVVDLHLDSAASASACLVRALDIEGHRLVMLTDHAGVPWFTATTGEPYAPGRGSTQPGVARAIEQAMANGGTFRAVGGVGIAYKSGKTNPWVEIDVAVLEGLVFVVATPTLRDSRAFDAATWDITCPRCSHDYTPDDSAGTCGTCRGQKCPECGGCDCEEQVAICDRCSLTLPVAEARSGRTVCLECS